MRMLSDLAPETCVTDDETRRHLRGVFFSGSRKKLIATDGYILIAVPVDKSGLDFGDKLLPAGLFAQARREQDGAISLELQVGDSESATNEARFDHIVAKFPDSALELADEEPDTEKILDVSLNPRLLLRLAEALGEPQHPTGVSLSIRIPEAGPVTTAIRVESMHLSTGAVGWLMPMRRKEPDNVRFRHSRCREAADADRDQPSSRARQDLPAEV